MIGVRVRRRTCTFGNLLYPLLYSSRLRSKRIHCCRFTTVLFTVNSFGDHGNFWVRLVTDYCQVASAKHKHWHVAWKPGLTISVRRNDDYEESVDAQN
ncbi:unnamed protein product [Chondrus crispus]|uniref:Uncharacterized protein n=1 Tax=Chondrus crispus TaxID=2769 RepID=R7QP24_CHOCR|nr:unnamed protein product [Chondrus crispus]CDF39236.1 unnamed protein product [Chondrus crispus]|eukprot:XP_005719147.1 unnamed protein product [Chondrus crispus]